MPYEPKDFGPFKLSASSHSDPSEGMCVMEMVSFLAGEDWSDMPACSSPVVSQFCQVLNDKMGQRFRDKLQLYVPRLIGTASPEHDQERAEYLAWQAVKVFAPIALDAAKLPHRAEVLRSFDVSLGLSAAADAARYAADDAARYAAAADAACYAAADAAHYAARCAACCAATAVIAARYAARCAADTDAAARYAAIADAGYAAAVIKKAAFAALDGLLNIGPSGSTYTDEHKRRVEPLRAAIKQTA